MHPPLRIAILECDTPLENTNRHYGSYGGVFRALLTASAKALNQPDQLNPETGLDITRWDVVNGHKYPKLEEIDAVLLTGSRHNSFDDLPWINRLVEFTKQVLEQDRVRIVGVCFGHQIVGRALGAKVGRSDQGWEVSVCDMDLTDKGKEVFGRDTIRIQQMHQDIVFYYPPDVVPLGSSPLCAVQGMYAPRRFITVQGHPEFNTEIVTEIVESRTKMGVFGEEQAREAMSRVGNDHDGVAIGTAFLKFLLEE